MKNVILFLLFISLAFCTEQELIWDHNLNNTGWTYQDGTDGRIANDFTPTYQCHVSKVRIFPTSPPIGSATYVYVWNDNSGYPGTILGSKYFSNIIGGSWITLDISNLNLVINSGQKFYTGIMIGGDSTIINKIQGDSSAPIHPRYSSDNGGVTWNNISDATVLIRCIIDSDMTPPYVNGQVPAPQGNVNPPLNSIAFHCRDDDKGVDPDTIVFTCTGNGNPIPGTLAMDDSDIHDVICTFTPNTPIPGGVCVLSSVHSGLADGLGNATTSDITWWFTVGSNKVRSNSLGELKVLFAQ